jgi:hypothetical protein
MLGPTQVEMRRLEAEWRQAANDGDRAHTADFAADYLNRTAANLSSIVLLAELASENGHNAYQGAAADGP